jgi:hypothetical protein
MAEVSPRIRIADTPVADLHGAPSPQGGRANGSIEGRRIRATAVRQLLQMINGAPKTVKLDLRQSGLTFAKSPSKFPSTKSYPREEIDVRERITT